ncbi:actin [Reticulomyxa filosa]|uniref:Actin n=1 Tax=Reticulomyxa filosa TaxID=46433 RepID=X6MCH6_RETFI|nr:actin [Reticulomyxa filosa]|eukprot:ETO11356.1 actin [Reticulomyxa filosa]
MYVVAYVGVCLTNTINTKSELRVDPEEVPVLMTDNPFNTETHREKTAQIIYEAFDVPSFYLAPAAVLSLFATGNHTGMVIQSGHGITLGVPVQDGSFVNSALSQLDMGGEQLVDYMTKLLSERGYTFTTIAEKELVRDIKEKLAFVTLNYEDALKTEKNKIEQRSYELPDGMVIRIDQEQFKCPEPLFTPSLLGLEQDGIHKMVRTSILKCNQDIQKDLYNNIVFAGGNTMFGGIAERMTKELEALLPNSTKIRIVSPPERKYSAWIGGSILSCLSPFQKMWIPKSAYDEIGPSIAHRKYNFQ